MSFVFNSTNHNSQVIQGQYASGNFERKEQSEPKLIMQTVSTLVTDEVVRAEVEEVSAMPEEEMKKPENLSRIQSLIDRLSPWGPQIAKACVAFGDAALRSLASTNPLVSGLVAMIGQIKKEQGVE